MIKREKDVVVLLMFSSLLLCFAYLFTLINGYYYYFNIEFQEIGRKDLLARLGFLSSSTGVIYYPFVVFQISIMAFLLKRVIKLEMYKIWFGLFFGVLVIGIFFYAGLMNGLLLYGSLLSVMSGIALWLISVILYIIAFTYSPSSLPSE
ncbi:hypothetical protein KFE94_07195 [bacterium SCSIO 12643]|nr:hypothetical protein KFE94_07195 [bacterium SCSIO 12643]